MAVAVLAIVVAACSGDAAQTFHAGDVMVIDETTGGLVTGVELLDPPFPSEVAGPTAEKGDSFTQVVVTWTGNGCIQGWTLRLSGNALELAIEPGSPISGCEGVEGAHRVRLDLNRVVEVEGITVTQAGY